jgi:Asp-tRNA(Asn)/Glu-tRNA(Gln) amidotransferase A subunit family amidase
VLRQFLEALESGQKTPADLLYDCLSQIAATEPTVRAWVEVSAQPFLEGKPLSGIPYGAKDIIETNGLVTGYGSPLYEGRQGEFDADVVATLRHAGALLLGKTQTTAFASFDPAPTRNPRLAGHTPGGSSSGSAAAVAAGMVPFAVGTQTLGSVLRPASYCGVCGFKPTSGLIPATGVLPFAPSLDTVGFFTQTAADMACLWSRGFGGNVTAELHRAALLRVKADPPMTRAVENAATKLRQQGVVVEEMDPPAGMEPASAYAWPTWFARAWRSRKPNIARPCASWRKCGPNSPTCFGNIQPFSHPPPRALHRRVWPPLATLPTTPPGPRWASPQYRFRCP